MKHAATICARPATWVLLLCACSCSLFGPPEPRELLNRSLAAHGGANLSDWQTLTIRGTVEMFDGIKYNAAYLVLAKMPGRLRVEHDLTADRGRRFSEYYLNGGVTWSRTNLLPGKADPDQLRRWWNQCFGIAYYARNATEALLKGEARVEYMEPAANQGIARSSAGADAFVLQVKTGEAQADLYVDKETWFLVQEDLGKLRRQFRDFKEFGGVVMPTTIGEITSGPKGETILPFKIQSVKYNEAIEDWVFAEDMPAKKSQ
jgi:hypothetical protein